MPRSRAVLLLLVGLLPALLGAASASAEDRSLTRVDPRLLTSGRVVADPFEVGQPYAGDFPDPAILRVGRPTSATPRPSPT